MSVNISSFLEEMYEKKIITQEEYVKVSKDTQTNVFDDFQSLLKIDLLNEELIIPEIAKKMGLEYISLKKTSFTSIHEIPAKYAYHYCFVPLEYYEDRVVIACSTPSDLQLIDEIQTVLQKKVEVKLAGRKDIKTALKIRYGIGADTVQEMIDNSEEQTFTKNIENSLNIDELDDEASIIKFVNQVVFEAIKERATDIHIEPFDNELKIRYRIDGILYDAPFPTTIKHFHSPIISRLKIMSNLNISEKRLPQDGRIKVKFNNTDIDLRISILPTSWGEAANIRVLNGTSSLFNFKQIGLNDKNINLINNAINKPHGMILVTGPTGSGKTTTLYTALNKLNTADKKIITIEDPVEYLIKGISQLQINTNIDFNFAKGLRSMLRHDPDVMMVGEIRDYETAEIAIRAALTGHLVFSTIHTNDAASTITRMVDIGVENYLIASSLHCVIAQRLVRVLCDHCKKQEKVTKAIRNEFIDLSLSCEKVYIPQGCSYCKHTGFKGRIGIFEIIALDEGIRELIHKHSSTEQIRKYAKKNGMKTLRQSGLIKVEQGLTSLSEIIRITMDIQ